MQEIVICEGNKELRKHPRVFLKKGTDGVKCPYCKKYFPNESIAMETNKKSQ